MRLPLLRPRLACLSALLLLVSATLFAQYRTTFQVTTDGNVRQLSITHQGPAALLVDTDGNGLFDVWEQHYFGHLGVNPQLDPDNDGISNLLEQQYGRDPNVSDLLSEGTGAGLDTVPTGVASYVLLDLAGPGEFLQKLANGGWVATNNRVFHAGTELALPSGTYGVTSVNSRGQVLIRRTSPSDSVSKIWDVVTGTLTPLQPGASELVNWTTGYLMSENFIAGSTAWHREDYNVEGAELTATDLDGAVWGGDGRVFRKLGTTFIGHHPQVGFPYTAGEAVAAWRINDNGDVLTSAGLKLNGLPLTFEANDLNNSLMLVGEKLVDGNWDSGWWQAGQWHSLGSGSLVPLSLNNRGDFLAFEVVRALGLPLAGYLFRRTGTGVTDYEKIPLDSLMPPGWQIDYLRLYAVGLYNRGAQLNDDGAIALNAVHQVVDAQGQPVGAAESRLVLLQPGLLQLAVDANRDGTIKLASDDASDATSGTNPSRFWLNDDDDDVVNASEFGLYEEIEDDDKELTNPANEDWRNNVLDTPRDLEDFARLWVNTQGLNDSFKNGQLYLGLKWKNTTGTPAIKLHRSRDTTGSADYLFNTTAASLQSLTAAIVDARYPDYVLDGNFQSDHTLIEGSGMFIIPTVQFSALSESNSRTAFLFEGCKAGTGQLALVILKKEGSNYNEIGEGPGVWLDLKSPKDFIERWSAGNDVLGVVQPVVRENSKSVSPAWGNPVTEDGKDYVLYVHGYNMQEFEKQRWIETTYKRLYWLGYKGRVGGFTWPCSQSAPPLDASEERAWESAAQLRTLLSGLKTAGYRVHVLGHSQGNVVVGEALRQWKEEGNTTPLVRTYIASQAAIPAHCYDIAAPLIPGFAGSLSDDGTPNVYVNFPPTGAPYMGAVAMSGAATKWVNFENPGDYALTGNSLDPLDFHPGWEANQRLKPDVGYGWSVTNGYYVQNINTGAITPLHTPIDRFRIFSYGAEGRSLALGSTTTGGVFAGNNTDLAATLSYGLHHRFHSGQFRSFMSERYRYWQFVMQSADLTPGP